jgi:hypothetical protein
VERRLRLLEFGDVLLKSFTTDESSFTDHDTSNFSSHHQLVRCGSSEIEQRGDLFDSQQELFVIRDRSRATASGPTEGAGCSRVMLRRCRVQFAMVGSAHLVLSPSSKSKIFAPCNRSHSFGHKLEQNFVRFRRIVFRADSLDRSVSPVGRLGASRPPAKKRCYLATMWLERKG